MVEVNVKKAKMIISSENAEKVRIEGESSCAVCEKSGGSNSILC